MSSTNQAILELHKISQEISVQHDKAKTRNKQLGVVLQDIIVPALKNDALFCKLFAGVYFTGSYFQGLKMDKPDQFDMIFKLQLPIMEDDLQFKYERKVEGHMKIVNLQHELPKYSTSETNKTLISWCEGTGEFDSQKLFCWFKTIVEKYLVPELENKKSILLQQNLHYTKMEFVGFECTVKCEEMDIGLVPALKFNRPYSPKVFKPYVVRSLPEPDLNWFLIPGDLTPNWKMCMKEYENRLLRENIRRHLKPAIRLIRKLRVAHPGWQKLTSYPIYNAAFWACKPKNPRIPESMSVNLEDTFFGILEELHAGLKKNQVQNYWTNANNDGMLQTLQSKKSRRKMTYRIDDVLGQLKSVVQRGDAAALRELFQEGLHGNEEISDDDDADSSDPEYPDCYWDPYAYDSDDYYYISD